MKKPRPISTFSLAAISVFSIMVLFTFAASSLVYKTPEEIPEEELETMISSIYNSISTYINIDHVYGKYATTTNGRSITHLAVLINPYFSTSINIDEMILEIVSKSDIHHVYFSGNSSTIASDPLFSHHEWTPLSSTQYSLITLYDADSSIEQINQLNDCTDKAYIILKLPDSMMLNNKEHIEMNILCSSGMKRSILLKPPFSTRDIVQIQ
jgi:archaellin